MNFKQFEATFCLSIMNRVRQEREWGPTFDRLFQKFVTIREPEDKWTFECLDASKIGVCRLPSIFMSPAALIHFLCSVSHLMIINVYGD